MFTIVDPVICLGTAYGYVFDPDFILRQFTPSPVQPLAPETRILTDTMAGVFILLAVLYGYLLRVKPTDLTVWRAVQAGTLTIDGAILGALARSTAESGRLNFYALTREEIGSAAFTGFVAILRLAFLLKVGFSQVFLAGDGKRTKKSL